MNVRADVLSAALRDLEQKRQATLSLLERRRQEVFLAIPDMKALDDSLSQTAPGALWAALAEGRDPEAAVSKARAEHRSLQKKREALLKRHGYAPDYLTFSPDCSLCSDTGYQGAALCPCLQQACAKAEAAQLSPFLRHSGASFDGFDLALYSDEIDPRFRVSPRHNMERVLDIAIAFAKTFGSHRQNLLLHGSSGLGKTFLSTSIAREVAANGFRVSYDSAGRIVAAFEKSKFEADEEARATALSYERADLLIVDDLGAELTNLFTITVLYDLINTRLIASRPTIVSTNLLPTDLDERYSPMIASRLTGEYTPLRFFGEDIRRQRRTPAAKQPRP